MYQAQCLETVGVSRAKKIFEKKNFGSKLQNRNCETKMIIEIIINNANYKKLFTVKLSVYIYTQ